MIDENGTLDLTGIKEIKNNNYYGNREELKKLIIGNTLEKLKESLFYGCENLEEIDFSNTILKKISFRCFCGCTSLKSIHLPSSIKFIDTWAFHSCSNLESVILDGVNKIRCSSFKNCDNLKEFVFYEDVGRLEKLERLVRYDIFKGIPENQEIKITCPDKYIDYFKKRFPESEINNDNQYILK